jgi:hypothetical protein
MSPRWSLHPPCTCTRGKQTILVLIEVGTISIPSRGHRRGPACRWDRPSRPGAALPIHQTAPAAVCRPPLMLGWDELVLIADLTLEAGCFALSSPRRRRWYCWWRLELHQQRVRATSAPSSDGRAGATSRSMRAQTTHP